MTNSTEIPNRLINEKSPYLLQHAYNPVDWFPWGEEAFEKARLEDKPVFLSIGYSTCHWCHVMNRESFMDDSIAKLLNGNFVCIKLDREERPDIDGLYMDACTALSGHGGWPLTAFLNHDKSPFFAGTYYPRDQLAALLANISTLWTGDRVKLTDAGAEFLSFLSRPISGESRPRHQMLEDGVNALESAFDPEYGGFMPAPKFPSLQRLLFLLRHHTVSPTGRGMEIVEKSLRGMAKGGIFDHVGGGFFRYSTDEKWKIPHYEKMLYDNAMSILTYGEAAALLNDPALADIAARCCDFITRELKCEDGGFYTALDAESPKGEGAFYLWTGDEVANVLGREEGHRFAEFYNIGGRPSLPNLIGADTGGADPAVLDKLYRYRADRERPRRDEKILSSGNALTAAALASAGRLLGKPEWITQAEKTADFILRRLCSEGRLKASYFDGRASHKAVLDDYAYFVWALIELYEATFRPKWLGLAKNWNAHMLELFGGSGGGLFLSGRDVADLPLRQKVYLDGPLPSGNAVAAMNLIRLSAICGEEEYLETADGILTAAAGAISKYPASSSGLQSAILLAGNIRTLTISSGAGQDLLLQATEGYHPFLQVICGSAEKPETVSRVSPSAASSLPIDGRAAAYLCDAVGCHKPVTEKRKLSDMLTQ